MKIIQINSVYKTGSTGKIMYDLHTSYLKDGHNSYVIYGRGARIKENNVFKVSCELEAKIHSVKSRLFGVDFGFSFFATKKAIKIIKTIKPDIVHLHCLNGHFINVYKLLDFLKNNNISTILTLHAEIMHTAGCEHAMDCIKWMNMCSNCNKIKGIISSLFRDDAKHCYKLMKDAFCGFDNLAVIGCSEWIVNRAKLSSVFKNTNCLFDFIHNDINYDIFHYTASDLRKQLGIPNDKKIILNVTSNFYHPVKGPQYFIEIATQMPDYQFIVVGFTGDKTALPNNVLTIEKTENQIELAKFYSIADCFISTSIRETLPTVCLEAAACGCNVLAFDSGGARETICSGHGNLVTPYNIDEFIEKIKYWANQDRNNQVIYDGKPFYKKYIDVYKRFIK